jgi:DNA transposition AAA+ family ATPase
MIAELSPPLQSPLPSSVRNSEASSIHGVRRWTILPATVKLVTEAMPEEQGAELRWLCAYGIEKNLTIDEVAAQLKKRNGDAYSRDSVYQALTGRREAKLDSFVASVIELRRSVEARASVGFPFVEWPRSEKIFDLCEMAFTFQDIVFIYGRSHAGKTVPLKQYAKSKPFGRVVYLELVGAAISAFKADLAGALSIGTRNRGVDLNKMIREALDPSMILIVDQFHRCVVNRKGNDCKTLDYIMHLRDVCGCGVVLCGTPQAKAEIENPKSPNAEFYRQLINRSVGTFMVEDAISEDDLALFSAAVGLLRATGEALDLQTSTVSHHSLGKWIKVLRQAMRMAANKGHELSWLHVIKANAWMKQQGDGK